MERYSQAANIEPLIFKKKNVLRRNIPKDGSRTAEIGKALSIKEVPLESRSNPLNSSSDNDPAPQDLEVGFLEKEPTDNSGVNLSEKRPWEVSYDESAKKSKSDTVPPSSDRPALESRRLIDIFKDIEGSSSRAAGVPTDHELSSYESWEMYKACILPKEIERLNELTPLEILQESAQLHLSLEQHNFSMALRLEQEIERNGKLEAMLSKAKSEEDQKIAEGTKAYYAEIETLKEQKMKADQEISSLKRELEKRKSCLAEIKSTVAKFQSDFEL